MVVKREHFYDSEKLGWWKELKSRKKLVGSGNDEIGLKIRILLISFDLVEAKKYAKARNND